MFPVENKSEKRLMFKCKHCANKVSVEKSEKNYCVYQNYVQMEEETNIDAVINSDVIMDPTLPRSREVVCPECGNDEAVYFQVQSKNPDDAMTLLFVCTANGCEKYWRRNTE